jgi:hypothetical protein
VAVHVEMAELLLAKGANVNQGAPVTSRRIETKRRSFKESPIAHKYVRLASFLSYAERVYSYRNYSEIERSFYLLSK